MHGAQHYDDFIHKAWPQTYTYTLGLLNLSIKLSQFLLYTRTPTKSERAPTRVCHYELFFGDDLDLWTPDPILYSYLPLTMQHLCIKYESCNVKSYSSFHIDTFVVSRAFMAGAASQAGDADSSRAPGLTSGLQGSMNVHCGALLLVPKWQCISSFVFYIKLSCQNQSAYKV